MQKLELTAQEVAYKQIKATVLKVQAASHVGANGSITTPPWQIS